MDWGREIEVNGVRPTWLRDDDILRGHDCDARGTCAEWDWKANTVSWTCVDYIRLPACHWAYRALDAGFEPWPGGDAAPDDWDGENFLYLDGDAAKVSERGHPSFRHLYGLKSVIGYRKKKPCIDAQDFAVISKMTEAEAVERFGLSVPITAGTVTAMRVLRDLNLIREETRAERFTRETGHAVTPAVEAALEFDR